MKIEKTPIGKKAEEISELKEAISSLTTKLNTKGTEMLKLMKDSNMPKVSVAGYTFSIKHSSDELTIHKQKTGAWNWDRSNNISIWSAGENS